MDYPSLRGECLPDYLKKSIWNPLHSYIDAHSQILIDECPGDGLQSISRLKYQCANMIFADQSRYNRLFHQVIQKGGESAINYIKIFQNAKALSISVVNSYSEYQVMHTLFDNFQKSGKTLLRWQATKHN